MGVIMKNGIRHGGYFTGPAQDIFFDHRETVCTSANVQGAIHNLSDLFDNTKGVSSIPSKETCAIVSSDNHNISIPSISLTGVPSISIDGENIGTPIMSDSNNDCYEIKKIQVGINPSTSNLALMIIWFDGTDEQTNYIDFSG